MSGGPETGNRSSGAPHGVSATWSTHCRQQDGNVNEPSKSNGSSPEYPLQKSVDSSTISVEVLGLLAGATGSRPHFGVRGGAERAVNNAMNADGSNPPFDSPIAVEKF